MTTAVTAIVEMSKAVAVTVTAAPVAAIEDPQAMIKRCKTILTEKQVCETALEDLDVQITVAIIVIGEHERPLALFYSAYMRVFRSCDAAFPLHRQFSRRVYRLLRKGAPTSPPPKDAATPRAAASR